MSEPAESRPTFAAYRSLMESHGFRPSRRFGQNFLLDPSLHRVIADAAELGPESLALEVGAGLGFLTRELAARAARVVAVEIDDRLAAILRGEIPTWPHGDRVELVHVDAMARGEVAPEVHAAVAGSLDVAIVANLPYAVSGRFLAAALTDPRLVTRTVVVVVQRELAERLAAAPGGREYGGLSVLAQASGPVELLRTIGRDVFRPRPNVDSALVKVRTERPLPVGFGEFVRHLFAARRKRLRHGLERAGVAAAVADPEVARFVQRRAEECSAEEMLELFRRTREVDENPD